MLCHFSKPSRNLGVILPFCRPGASERGVTYPKEHSKWPDPDRTRAFPPRSLPSVPEVKLGVLCSETTAPGISDSTKASLTAKPPGLGREAGQAGARSRKGSEVLGPWSCSCTTVTSLHGTRTLQLSRNKARVEWPLVAGRRVRQRREDSVWDPQATGFKRQLRSSRESQLSL